MVEVPAVGAPPRLVWPLRRSLLLCVVLDPFNASREAARNIEVLQHPSRELVADVLAIERTQPQDFDDEGHLIVHRGHDNVKIRYWQIQLVATSCSLLSSFSDHHVRGSRTQGRALCGLVVGALEQQLACVEPLPRYMPEAEFITWHVPSGPLPPGAELRGRKGADLPAALQPPPDSVVPGGLERLHHVVQIATPHGSLARIPQRMIKGPAPGHGAPWRGPCTARFCS